jgi:hypothetical protein
MSIYMVEAPGEYPENITRWSVKEVLCEWSDVRTRHLVGYIQSMRDGRASSPIQQFDPGKMSIQTRSGRIYQLVGEPGINSDADYIWKHYKRSNGATDEIDVTKEYIVATS